ncbi:hypothetical protein [Streptoalloteichus hindustanus]|uniref:Uncharacterized protein n=1 Tax=Streptoalloteichus hindustanus TaxID=2017 RepID=A0A1M5FE39_STRHI|nr:hypothetical protein [Streptoalloteichus hindustanus]SHF89351.1 hypothetical protein SAMN05444320_105381 [Streptoalloteichus hindustanus]
MGREVYDAEDRSLRPWWDANPTGGSRPGFLSASLFRICTAWIMMLVLGSITGWGLLVCFAIVFVVTVLLYWFGQR